MIFDEIHIDIKNAFGKLWNVRKHGESLEIITPFVTTSDKFVSLFLTKRKDKFVVSDGGWIADNTYGGIFEPETNCFNKVFLHYIHRFNIKETKSLYAKPFFYKSTEKAIFVPSIVLDMCNFVSVIASISEIEFNPTDDETQTKRFRGLANDYISTIVEKDKIDFQGYLNDDDKTIKVSAIIKPTVNKLILVNYITGSNRTHFLNSIGRTNLMFQMAEASKFNEYITDKIALIDNTSFGYQIESGGSLDFALEKTHSSRVYWTDKKELLDHLN